MSLYLSLSLSIGVSVSLSICLSISIYLYFSLSIFIYIYLYLCLSLTIFPSIRCCLLLYMPISFSNSIPLSLSLSPFNLSISLSLLLSPFNLSISLSLSLYLHSIYTSLSLSPTAYLAVIPKVAGQDMLDDSGIACIDLVADQTHQNPEGLVAAREVRQMIVNPPVVDDLIRHRPSQRVIPVSAPLSQPSQQAETKERGNDRGYCYYCRQNRGLHG